MKKAHLGLFLCSIHFGVAKWFFIRKNEVNKIRKTLVKLGIDEAVDELNQILKGKKKGCPTEDLFVEL